MKLPVIGDIHLGARNDNLALMEHQLRFFEDVLFPFIDEQGCKYVLQSGDLLDRRKYSNHSTIDVWKKRFFNPLRDRGVKLITIVGNHDIPFKNTVKVNTPKLLFKEYANIQVIDEPTEIRFEDNTEFLFLPWICSENLKISLDKIQSTSAQYVLGHLELQGFEWQRGSFSDGGQDPEIFSRFDLVLSGHFHHKSTRNNIVYLGTPYELTWSDFNDQKGFHVFDTQTKDLTFVRNPVNLHNKIHYDDTGKTLDDITNIDFEKYTGTYVKVIVSSKNNPYWYDIFIDKLEKANPINIASVDDHLNLNLEDEKEIIEGAENIIDILNGYIDGVDLSVTDKEALKKLMIGLYHEALSIT